MALVPIGIVTPYVGTHASLPLSGWSRKTSCDDQYIRIADTGNDADDTTANGASSHGHSMAWHNHSFSSGNSSPGTYEITSPQTVRATTHSHASATSWSAVVTLNTTTNDLKRIEAIYVESDGTPTGFLDDAVCFFRDDALPTNWNRINGDGFIKGKAAGADGSVTQTGTSIHTHTETSTHTHPGTYSSSTFSSASVGQNNVGLFANTTHYHLVTFTNTSITFSSDTVEPQWRKINVIRNETGGLSFPDKICALFDGTHAGIPTDWSRLTSWDNRFIKAANADGESDVSSGGSLAHAHTQSHTHSASHGNAINSSNSTTNLSLRRGGKVDEQVHSHTWSVSNNTTSTWSNTSESSYPLYRELILLEWTQPASGPPPTRMMTGVGL